MEEEVKRKSKEVISGWGERGHAVDGDAEERRRKPVVFCGDAKEEKLKEESLNR